MGGMQALEWAIMYPERVRVDHPGLRLHRGHRPADRVDGASAAGPSASTRAGGAATTTTPRPATGPHEGLAVARQIAQVTFRSDEVFTDRFGRSLADADTEPLDLWQRFEVERYLDYHGDKLVRRFDANSLPACWARRWTSTTWPAAGGAATPRWPASRCPSLSIGVWSDHALPVVPAAADGRAGRRRRRARPTYAEIDSPHGHDAFLIDVDQVGDAIAKFLADVET